jgi:3-oxoacyl-[acyl-carrier-protein] synthase-3
MAEHIAIVGAGYAVPQHIRTNDDPIFDWLRAHGIPPNTGPFTGFKERRVLPAPGTLTDLPTTGTDLMIAAARQALQTAHIKPAQVDLLVGWDSISEFITPNGLTVVHRELKLRPDAWLVPVEGLENFSTALMTADALIKSKRGKVALVVAGCNWTQYVDYHTPQSVSAGDGAGAVVLAHSPKKGLFYLLDAATQVVPKVYGGMFMQGDPVPGSKPPAWSWPYFHITATGMTTFNTLGMEAPAQVGNLLLERNKVKAKNISMITHQASKVLMDAWDQKVGPGQYLSTRETFANMVSATVPVNFAYFSHKNMIKHNHLLLLNPSAEFKAVGALLKRSR